MLDDAHRAADRVRRRGAALHVEGHHGAEARVAHYLHGGMLREPVGEIGRRRGCALEPQRERAHAADCEKRLQGTGRGSGQLAALTQLVRALGRRGDNGSEQEIRVPAQVLRGRVHDQIGTQLKWALHERCREGAVDHH